MQKQQKFWKIPIPCYLSTKMLNKSFSKNYFSLTKCESNFFTDPTFTNYFSVCNAATILQGRSLRNFR